MNRLIAAVECDFEGYQPFESGECRYDHKKSLEDIKLASRIISSEIGGKAAYLIHTSPYVRRNWNDVFFTSPDYLTIWDNIVAQGGELGLHLHEEEPDGSCHYYGYAKHLHRIVQDHVTILGNAGFTLTCESTGYFGGNEWLVPILEEHRLLVNLDNVGVFTKFTGRNWIKSPNRPYLMDRTVAASEGDSGVLSIPLGMTSVCRGEDGLMVGSNGLRYLKDLWRNIAASSNNEITAFVWIEAARIRRDWRKLASFLKYLKAQGVEFIVPSTAYRDYGATADMQLEDK